VHGLGHAAVLIGNDKTGYNYYSKNGTNESGGASGALDKNPVSGRHYASLKEFEQSEDNKKDGPYKKAYDIKTDEATDKKMEEAAKASVKSDYNTLEKNCVDVASDAAKAGGLNPGTPNLPWYLMDPSNKNRLTPIPNLRFRRMIENNPGGTLIILPEPKKERIGTITVDPAEITHKVIPDDKKPNQ